MLIKPDEFVAALWLSILMSFCNLQYFYFNQLDQSLGRVINGFNCHVFWCYATSCYLCMSRCIHDLKDSALFGDSLRRKLPEKQHINGFSKSVRLSEHCSRALDKQFPLFCFDFFLLLTQLSMVPKFWFPGKSPKARKHTWSSFTLSLQIGPFCFSGDSAQRNHTDTLTTGFSQQDCF